MSLLQATIVSIKDLDQGAIEQAQRRLDNLTKPPGSLGVLEEIAARLAGITGNPRPVVGDKVIILMAGDHGVVEEGVSAFPKEVTEQMVLNFARGGAAINVLSRHVGARVVVVDIGVDAEIELSGVIQRKVRRGTRNMAKGPAMTRAEAVEAIEVGIQVAQAEIGRGATLLGTGDMGIGNTTPSSAILAVFSGLPVSDITGRGTGLTDQALLNKVRVIEQAIRVNGPDPSDPLDVLAKVGGLEIAGLTGVILGAAACRIPVVVDGFISSAAALVASRLAPQSVQYMIASHASVEPGHRKMLELIGLVPMLHMKMRLGEGTGAALVMNLVEAATKIMAEMATFADAGVSNSEECVLNNIS
ncbi:MAG: nicotinate-nucleotide--dimethylbenzimidazole phosphoribosyltransferase [Firmicutes bacterium]|nr:nicotinate-nucleotide--dimethylbenzimidazole phosphoribosyltransferase [Bacillota bacterium]